jgi:beta-lactamase superfamily II metal-dependent hydrolase
VVSGLPAQGEPLAEALLDTIRPRVIIITDSEYPAGARASHALRERLARRHVPVLYTRECGAVTIEIRARTWRVRGMRGIEIKSSD